jgi:hypothetical protein
VKLVAASFGWPFRGTWPSRFAIGSLTVLLLPITFVLLLGYAIAATRTAEQNPTQGPPRWRLSGRLIADGFWTALFLLVLSAPFILAWNPLADVLPLQQVYAHIAAALLLALPWGLLLLLLMPHATSRFAATGRPRDLFDFPSALRGVRHDFPAWNVAAAAIVTAWAIGVACIGLLCVGFLPGMFYAILVSAHASATLRQAGASGPHLSAG